MPGVGRYVVTFTNDSVGAGNPAQCSFDLTGGAGLTVDRCAMILAFYFAGGTTMAGGTRIPVISHTAPGAAGSTPCVWEDGFWTTLRGVYPDFGVPDWAGYNEAFGAGPLTPLGTSLLLLEQTNTPGRRSTGRKYIPFMSGSFVNAAGQVAPAAITNIPQNYNTLLIDGSPLGDSPGPFVRSKFPEPAGSTYLITSTRAMPTLANLRRRRR